MTSAVVVRTVWFRRAVATVAVVAIVIYPLTTHDASLTRRLLFIGRLGLPAIALNVTLGYSGEFAIGQAGLFAAGAYTAAVLTTNYEWSFWPALIVATIGAGVIGVVAG